MKTTKQQLSIRLISMFLIVLIVISSLSIPTYAINYDQRTKVINTAITKAKEIVTQYPMDGSTKTYKFKTAYDNLNSKQKQIYKKIYKSIKAVQKIKLSGNYKTKDIDNAIGALKKDYPIMNEYVDLGYSYDAKTKKHTHLNIYYYKFYTDGSHKYPGEELTTKKERNMLRKEIDQYTKRVDKLADMIVKGMPSGISTIDKYRYLAACLCYITKYNNTAADSALKDMRIVKNRKAWSYDSAFVYGLAVCQGYSCAYEYLCKKANLYCIEVDGFVTGDAYHAWNLVKLQEGTYFIDVTWMDGNTPDSKEWYNYFMRTSEEIKSTHIKPIRGITTTGKKSFADIYNISHAEKISNNLKNGIVKWSASKQNDITVKVDSITYILSSVEPFKVDEYNVDYTIGSKNEIRVSYNGSTITIKGNSETLKKRLTENGKKLKVKVIYGAYKYSEFTIIRED